MTGDQPALQVVRVLAKLEPGGAQLSAFRLTRALRELGIESRLLVGDATREGIRLAREHGLAPEIFHHTVSGLQWRPDHEFGAWLAPRLDGCDLVHAHMFGGWWAAAQAIPDGVPLVASEHNQINWPGPAYDDAYRDALPRVDRFFAHGPDAAAYVLGLGYPPERLAEGRSAVTGIDARPLRGLPTPRVVFTGRLAPDKGPDLFVEAIGRLASPVSAFIVGEGALREQLEERVRALRLSRRVTFTGWQRHPGRWVAGASVFVQPSREEAFSQSTVLAMALGTPVVATAVEALPAVLAENRGVLVAPGDPAALATGIADLLKGRRVTDLAGARVYASAFTPARIARAYAEAYRELTGLRTSAAY